MNQPLKTLLKFLDRLNLDAAVIVSRSNKFYLTGYEYEEGYLLINASGIQLFVDSRFSIYARQQVSDAEVIESRQPAKDLNKHLRKSRHIGFDGSALLQKDFMVLTSGFSGKKFTFIDQHLLKMRSVKSTGEIDYIRKASSISGTALQRLIGRLSSGWTEKQTAATLDLELINSGADDISFDTVIAFDERAAYAHALPSNTVTLRDKRLILCDFGALYRGYHSDETHTFFTGNPGRDEKKVYDAVLGAHNRAIDAVKPGMKASDLDRVARGFLERQGYGKYFGHALGHGVGLDVHESPSISYRSKDVLKCGMIFTIEPGVYIPDWGGVRIESMVYLSDNGKEVLTGRQNPVLNLEV